MRRAAALALLVALSGTQALPLVAGARVAATETADAHHHHPPGCPWQGTPDCPHEHHGPSSQPVWSRCAEAPLPVAAEARMAWAPPLGLADEALVPVRSGRDARARDRSAPRALSHDVEIPPPRTTRSV